MKLRHLLITASALIYAGAAHAGPFILDGTDSDDHGSASGGVNLDGWEYIQKALQNLASSSDLTKTQKNVAILGATSSALAAAQSAINGMGGGWTFTSYAGAAGVNNFFTNTSGSSLLYIASDGVTGGTTSAISAALLANANNIDTFLGQGGGLFSMGHDYSWLSALVPGLTITGTSGNGQSIALTPEGNAAFPGLTNADLSTGPYHYTFRNTGAIPILAREATGVLAPVIIGGAAGNITNPGTGAVPEPATWAMMIMGFGLVGASLRRRSTSVRFETASA